MIPLYKQVKPLIANSNKVLSNLQNIKIPKNNIQNTKNNQVINNHPIVKPPNVPTFFQ